MLTDWDFKHLISAHTGGCFDIAKEVATTLIDEAEPMLRKLSVRNAAAAAGKVVEPEPEEPLGWSNDPKQCECG